MKPFTFVRPKQRRRVDHLAKMIAGDVGLIRIIGKRVGVVAKCRDLHLVLFAQRANIVGLRLREVLDIDMARAAVRPILFRARPAHDFDALITFAAGEG